MSDRDEGCDIADARPESLPPGQRRVDELRPIHYGRVPRIDLATWSLTVSGHTADGRDHTLSWADLQSWERTEVSTDHHCVSRRTVEGVRWGGIPARALLEAVPAAPGVECVLAYGSYGYHSNVTVQDLLATQALLATHLDGEPLRPEHGWPLRLVLPHLYGWKGPKWLVAVEYCLQPRRGFWEQRGYHYTGSVWREERYAHQE